MWFITHGGSLHVDDPFQVVTGASFDFIITTCLVVFQEHFPTFPWDFCHPSKQEGRSCFQAGLRGSFCER